MDPVTQGVLGASLAGSLSKKNQTRAAIFAGTIGGLFPDFDILITLLISFCGPDFIKLSLTGLPIL